MREYVTADPHFFHENIIRFCNRPVRDVKHMNEQIMDIWSHTVDAGDVLYILGDIYFGGKDKGKDVALILSAVPADKILVMGNHDNLKSWPKELIDCFDQVLDAKIIRRHKTEIFMSHRPLMIDEYWKGDVVNLHGHVHGITPNPPGRLDVGVDPAWVYYQMPLPFLLEDAIAMALEDLPPTHHPGISLP